MKKHISHYDDKPMKAIESIPVCGQDFCDTCGDCLACYNEDGCGGHDGKDHLWVEYIDKVKNNS